MRKGGKEEKRRSSVPTYRAEHSHKGKREANPSQRQLESSRKKKEETLLLHLRKSREKEESLPGAEGKRGGEVPLRIFRRVELKKRKDPFCKLTAQVLREKKKAGDGLDSARIFPAGRETRGVIGVNAKPEEECL